MNTIEQVQRVDQITYRDFFMYHMFKNIPIIVANLATEWRSRNEWVDNNEPNFAYLQQHFGHSSVPVAHCETKQYSDQKREQLPLFKYLSLR